MSAVVHFVAFADDGVIESTASAGDMPGATDAVEKDGHRKPIVKSASGKQRFACGPGRSKWWGAKDDKNVLHVASGEPERVTCAACKLSKEYRNATGQSDQQGAVNVQGTPEFVEPDRPDDAVTAV